MLQSHGCLADAREPARLAQFLLDLAARRFVGHPALGDADARHQMLPGHRFGDVVVRAGVEHRLEVSRAVAHRDDEDERAPIGVGGADATTDLEPVEVRHLDVQNDQRVARPFPRRPRLSALVGGFIRAADGLHHVLDQQHRGRIVVRDQYLWGGTGRCGGVTLGH